MQKKLVGGIIILAILLAITAAVVACAGKTGPAGPQGPQGPAGPQGPPGATVTGAPVGSTTTAVAVPVAAAQPESCVVCHKDAGSDHQASYDELYQDGVIKVSDIKYSFSSNPDTTKVTFKMTKNGAPFDARQADSLAINFVPYSNGNFQFDNGGPRLALNGTLSYDSSSGITTSTLVEKAPGASGYVDYSDISQIAGEIVVYGRDETVGTIPDSRVTQEKYPYAAILETGKGVDYVSAANVAGCEKCHTTPYLKHGYIYGQVSKDASTDFYTCKACHLDNGPGGHYEWQLLVNDPKLAVDYLDNGVKLTDAQTTQYAYKTTLMNDVHMSHAMEFPYPQSMSNCVTCHEGKLDKVLTDANFTIDTCKSCHPVTGSKDTGTDKVALKTILPAIHNSMDLNTVNCASCHSAGKGAPTFKQIHSGYDTAIYTADGKRYSDAITVKIDSASVANNKLDIKFSAANPNGVGSLDVSKITPTVLVGLYGYDTKDYVVGPHERLTDDNKDGVIDSKDSRALEYVAGDKHPRFTTVSAGGGKWEVTADISAWANLVTDNTVKRVEIAVMPALKTNTGNITVALNSPSRTFNLKANAFDDKFFSPIVTVQKGCNNCHDALATTFHSADRGGNIVTCRLCHTTKTGGSHLELQSRSIDSYVHAIHSMQAFDVGSIKFSDPVAAFEYDEHIVMPYPTHGITDCESCHVKGTYDVPDQSKSLPGVLSASATLQGRDRAIGSIPSYVTGPASRACGACHRSQLINEDEASELASLLQHTKQGGYLIESGKDPAKTVDTVITDIMKIFK